MTTQHLFSNRATAKLAADVAANDTALTLVPGGGALFPPPGAGQYFRLVLQKGTAATDLREYMVCTGVAGDVLTVTRAQEGTPAGTFNVGDEVSLVATAATFTSLVQRVGATLQGALEVEAAPTTPLGIANKAFVESGRVNDVPNDGKTYGRVFQAWLALGAAAGLPVPIPVNAGGTGGATVAAAQTNLYIPVTTFDDLPPPTPKYGDRWIRPANMTEMVWAPNAGGGGAGIWINPADAASEAYPVAIAKGGTGATTAAQARINLGIDAASGQRQIADGTVAAPGVAFASELGLGFWRSGAGAIKLAQGGVTVWAVSGVGNDTFSGLYPKVAGGRGVWSLSSVPTGSANGNQLNLETNAAGYNFAAQNIGTGTSLPFYFSGGSAYRFDNAGYFDFSMNVTGRQANAAQIWLNKGGDGAENVLGSQVNGATQYRMIMGDATANATLHWQRYLNGAYASTFMQVNRQSGLITFGEAAGVSMAGPLNTGNSSIAAANGMGFLWDGNTANYLAMGSGLGSPWSWQWDRTTGWLRWLNNVNTPLFTIDGAGGITTAGGASIAGTLTMGASIQGKDGAGVAFGPGDFYAVHASGYKTLQWAAGYALRWSEANGTLEHVSNNAVVLSLNYQGHLGVTGNMTASNGQIAMTGNFLVCNTFGNSGGNLFSNVVAGSPGGMYQCVSLQHYPGVSASVQMQVGGENFTMNSSGTGVSKGGWVASDRATKTNIKALADGATAAVMSIPAVEWDRIEPDQATGKRLHQVGWVAQDVQPVFSRAVFTYRDWQALPQKEGGEPRIVDRGDKLALDPTAMTAVLWKAFQELNARVAQLEMQ